MAHCSRSPQNLPALLGRDRDEFRRQLPSPWLLRRRLAESPHSSQSGLVIRHPPRPRAPQLGSPGSPRARGVENAALWGTLHMSEFWRSMKWGGCPSSSQQSLSVAVWQARVFLGRDLSCGETRLAGSAVHFLSALAGFLRALAARESGLAGTVNRTR
jgi:hypothetical protein